MANNTTESHGPNLGLEVLSLYQQFEDVQNTKVNKRLDNLDDQQDTLETVTSLIQTINSDRQEGVDDIDYRDNPEKRALVDRAREKLRALFPHAIAENCYSWHKEEIDHLIENLNSASKLISHSVSMEMLHVTQGFHDKDHIAHISTDILRKERDSKDRIIRRTVGG